jgi:hypothetical protein
MTCANKEITKMLAAIVGCSRKQLSLAGVRFFFFGFSRNPLSLF